MDQKPFSNNNQGA